MNKTHLAGAVMFSGMMLSSSLYAESCNATFNPVTGNLHIPSLIVEGDPSGTNFWVDLLQRPGTLTFDFTGGDVNNAACYPVNNTGATITGSLADGDDEKFLTITAPSDPGGGYMTVAVTFDDEQVTTPWLTVTPINARTALLAGSSNEQTNTVLFEAAANQSYKLAVKRWTSDDPTKYPLNYNLTWSFSSKMDCYEPNNTIEQAAKISLDSTIEAFIIAGVMHDNYVVENDDRFDWYEITLDKDTNLTFDLLQVPNDLRMAIKVYNESGSQVWFGGSNATSFSYARADSDGALMNANLGIYSAGTYYIRVDSYSSLEYEVDHYPKDTIPDHFDTPYKFRITTSN